MSRKKNDVGKEKKPVKVDEKKLKEIQRKFEELKKKNTVTLARCHLCWEIFQLPSNRAQFSVWRCRHLCCHKCMHILESMGEFRCPFDEKLLPGHETRQTCLNNMLTEYMDVNDAEKNR